MYREIIQWFSISVSIICSIFRALNLGHQATTYLIGSMVQIIFIICNNDLKQRILNVFYLITSLIGVWRWTYQNKQTDNTSNKTIEKPTNKPTNRRLFGNEIV